MKFSYTAAWKDAVDLLQANAVSVAALAGVFLFLPALLAAHFLPYPETQDPKLLFLMWSEYFSANWPWMVLTGIVGMIGAIAIYLLFLDQRRNTVGGTIATAIMILPFYFIASFFSGIIIAIGFILLIVPGLYLFGRLALIAPIVVAEGQRNPFTAISRSFELTRGNGWAVLGLVLLVAIAGSIMAGVIATLLGIIFLMILGHDLGTFMTRVVQALTNAALMTMIYALTAAIYRQLRGVTSDAEAFR